MSLKVEQEGAFSKTTLKRSIKGWASDCLRSCFKLFIKKKSTFYLIQKFNNDEFLEIPEALSLLTRAIYGHLHALEGKKALSRKKSTLAIFQALTHSLTSQIKDRLKRENDYIHKELSNKILEAQDNLKKTQKDLEKANNENAKIHQDYQNKLKDSLAQIESLIREITQLKEKQKNLKDSVIAVQEEPSISPQQSDEISSLKEENTKLKEQLLEKQNEVSAVAQKANDQLTKLSQALVEKSKELEEAQTALITQINKLYKLTEDLKSMVRTKESQITKLGENLSDVLSYLHKNHPDLAQKIEDLYDFL